MHSLVHITGCPYSAKLNTKLKVRRKFLLSIPSQYSSTESHCNCNKLLVLLEINKYFRNQGWKDLRTAKLHWAFNSFEPNYVLPKVNMFKFMSRLKPNNKPCILYVLISIVCFNILVDISFWEHKQKDKILPSYFKKLFQIIPNLNIGNGKINLV